jgi:hypothetical protein
MICVTLLAADAGNVQRLAAERFGEPHGVGQTIALLIGQLQAAPRLDADRRPLRMQAVGQPFGVAHQPCRARIFAHADQNAFANGPRSVDGVGLHVGEQLLVDAVRGAPQRQFAQRGEVSGREIMLQRTLGLFGNVDLALLQPLDQVVRRQIDQFDGISAVEHRIRHRLAHPHMRDLGDHVVEAFDMLDVDRGIDIDAVGEQLLDVEIALGMPAAGRIGMREFVDEGDLGTARDQRVEVHFLERLVPVADRFARQHLKPLQQSLRLRPPMGLNDTDDNIGARLSLGVRILQHFIGLADAGSGADKDLQPAGLIVLPPGGFQ